MKQLSDGRIFISKYDYESTSPSFYIADSDFTNFEEVKMDLGIKDSEDVNIASGLAPDGNIVVMVTFIDYGDMDKNNNEIHIENINKKDLNNSNSHEITSDNKNELLCYDRINFENNNNNEILIFNQLNLEDNYKKKEIIINQNNFINNADKTKARRYKNKKKEKSNWFCCSNDATDVKD